MFVELSILLSVVRASPPNVVLMVLDDLGWADVSLHGGNFPTPNIDALATSGVQLDRMYVQATCTPTRSAIMTGRYPFKQGTASFMPFVPGTSQHLPLEHATLAEMMLERGYTTAAIGKWHLGYSKWQYTPTERGFESYVGYMQGATDYYTKVVQSGYDFWTNEVVIPRNKNYTMNAYRAEASRVLANAVQNPSKPFFLYYAQQEIHAPVQAPPSPAALAKCANITSSVGRRTLCSMAVTMDDEVGRVVDDLKAKNLWNNTLLWVTSDNGGMTEINAPLQQNVKSFSSNWPLRGSKTTLFEGGVRAVSFVCGGANVLPANARGASRTDLMHAVDIPTTIAAWAGATPPSGVDGFDLSKTITAGAQGQRTEVPVMIYPDCKEAPCKAGSGNRKGAAFSAVIQGDWKLITPFAAIPAADGYWTNEDQGYTHLPPPANDTSKTAWRLYNLAQDPLESNNVADQNPDKVAALQARITFYSAVENGYVGPQSSEVDPASNPDNHNGTWAPFE